MKCIVGLGNPGKEYELTRHNVGFMVVDYLFNHGSVKLEKETKLYWRALLKIENSEVVLVKPKTFMNLSGQAVLDCFSQFCESNPENLLVVVDEVHLPLGQIRIRSKGSSGGHNGLESVIGMLGTNNFSRLRLGIGKEGVAGQSLTDYVLGKFSDQELAGISTALMRADLACKTWATQNITAAMNQFNQKGDPETD